ncbi:hypothetical protein PLESTB_000924800 [Pleodorina starrii]|uniref:TLC domain-containing protein n=1 Tax=Pleodorina starrii TaxID=330485 RepID=A0A9W6F3D5_9CHLO|nr:hypothetical protein PLESTM_001560400 [Pleodorina starrii]GLC54957.1 hypothetical protein PLESTB_000924800 [Pleodorina starrii]GLC68480.1 hypothetical protein PLESTF_000696000 [Pleodorina starrii]
MSAIRELLNIAAANAPSLLPTFGYAVVWLFVRFFFYAVMRAYWRSKPAGKGIKDVGLQEKVLEESFAILGSLVATVLGIEAFRHSDRGSCGLLNTKGCFVGWPNAVGPRHSSVTSYHVVELGWYLHYLIKHPLGIGMEDNLQMHLHHFSTIALLLISFTLNLYRSGVLVLCLLNVSNPFLHVAKVVHYVEAPADKVTFLLFAVAFFVSRIVVYPLVVLRATLVESWQVHPPFLVADQHLGVYLAANVLLLLLMGMQLQWFAGIVRLLTKALAGDKDQFKKEGKAHDYARTKHD